MHAGILAEPASGQTSNPEVRATWLTTTGPDHVASGFNTETIFNQLHSVGINTTYVEAWKNGYPQFGSPAFYDLVGVDRRPGLGSRSLLAETGIAAHRNGQLHFAWFEYGFSPQFIGNGGTPSNPLAVKARDNGWLLQDQAGQFANASNGFAWMNPAVPEVRQLLIDITLDAVRTHDLDGIQFDDRLAWPREFGWDTTTATLYQQETGRSLPANVNDSDFRAWRQSKVTQFAVELNAAIRAERPDLRLSVSPSVTGFSDVNYNAKWTDWVAMGLFDEFVPQVYRDNLSSFRVSLPSNVQPFVDYGRLNDLVVGLRLNGTGADTPQTDLQQMIVDAALTQNGALAGHAIFYSKGVVDNAAALQQFYGNQRDSPFFDADHRPPPIVAGLSDGTWQTTVPQTEFYRLIAEIGGRWQEIDRLFLEAGTQDLDVQGLVTQRVELLLDRRPIPGDTNFDRRVDDLDLLTLIANFATAGSVQQGDFDGDGRVYFEDAEILAPFWQFGVSDPAALGSFDARLEQLGLVIPEPNTSGVLLLAMMIARRRKHYTR